MNRSLLVSFTLASLLAGSAAGSAATVKLVHWNWEESQDWLEKMAAEFKAQTGIEVDVEYARFSDMHEKLLTAIAGGVAPDVVMYSTGYGLFSHPQDFVDLRSFIKTDAAFSPQAFIPGGIDMLTEPGGLPDAGKILGLPWAFWTQSFGYNDAVWEKAGINPPADNWTWDDFKQIAKKFTTDTNGDGQADTHGAVVLVNVNRLGMILHNAGTFWFDRPILPLQSRLTDPKVLSVLDDLSQLYRQGVITNDGKSYNTGATAMYAAIAPNALSQTLRDQGVIQKFMRSPHWPNGQTGSELSVLSYSILQSSQHPKEAWEWIKFLTLNKQNQLALVTDPKFARIPANLTAMQQYFKAKAEIEPTISKFMDEVVSPESYARPEHPKLPQITNVLQKSLEKALLGAQSVSVKEAMLQANTQIEPILAEYR